MTSADHVALALLDIALAHPVRRAVCFQAIAAIVDVSGFLARVVGIARDADIAAAAPHAWEVDKQDALLWGRRRREALALGNSHALQRELAEEGA